MPSKTIVAIVAVALLLGLAMWKGVNGAALSSGIAIIAGLGGYAIAKVKKS